MDVTPQSQRSRIQSITRGLFSAAVRNRNFISGVVILLIVVFLWTASNFVTQNLYKDGYEKPFLVTYLNTSSFVLYLLPYYVSKHRDLWPLSSSSGLRHEYQSLNTTAEGNEEAFPEPTASNAPVQEVGEPRVDLPPLTTKQTAHLALVFCFLWFVANWTLDAALDYTTVASATILSSTSGFFTLGIGRLLRVEVLTRTKILSVVVSFFGVVLVYLSDSGRKRSTSGITVNQPNRPVLGDFLALVSAVFYALYVILLKIRIGSESRINMKLFFGFVGLFNILLAWPVGLFLHVIGAEVFEWPTSMNEVLALLINMGITVSSDFLYVIAMLRTTPLVVTVGLSLTIPFSIVGDIMLGHSIHVQVILGAMLIMSSFVAVGLDSSVQKLQD
ncbi:vacuolar membrane protein [Amanita rubescens]|nr:vacuolar membrane protein [Amanita rubescens]